ncbi:DoxX family protein [Haloferula sp. A504]|uniref:DoxX family protein n=1 Tax=Haloferula sp. A504 TaxID=3373601 RepID=UPI0031C6D8DB|nr:DoxX family protein [Verrucomicrobiaceae bacterium E54]
MKKFLFDCGTRDSVASAGLLFLRLGFGLMMAIGHGWPKVVAFEKLKDDWAVPAVWPLSYMSSPVSLIATIGAELGCAALLVLGLATRPAAFILGFAMVVAAFQVLGDNPLFLPAQGAKEPALLYLFACVALIVAGAGKASLDARVYKEKRRKFF